MMRLMTCSRQLIYWFLAGNDGEVAGSRQKLITASAAVLGWNSENGDASGFREAPSTCM
jgi:hypothetical protein